jgi:hypothetical protein
MLMLLVKHTPQATTSCTPLTSVMPSIRLVGAAFFSKYRAVITSTLIGEAATKVSFIVPVTTTVLSPRMSSAIFSTPRSSLSPTPTATFLLTR